MEQTVLKSSASQAKVIGMILSVSAALVIVLYEGPKLLSYASLTSLEPTGSLYQDSSSFDSSWMIGGVLLVSQYLLVSVWYILQVMEVYPEKTIVVCCTSYAVISAPVCMLAEKDLNSFLRKLGVPLSSAMYTSLCSLIGSVILSFGFYTVIWGKAREDSTRTVAGSDKSPLLVTHTIEDEASSSRCD